LSIEYIVNRYGVPATIGGRVIVHNGKYGTIQGTDGGSLRIRLDGETHVGKYHPTWAIEYVSPLTEAA